MIAKLISHGATRDEARRKLVHSLEQAVAFGVTTNQAFLRPACGIPHSRPARRRRLSSGIIATICWRRVAMRRSDAALAALLLYVSDPCAPPWRRGRTLAATFPLPARLELNHIVHDLEVVRQRDGGYVANS